jgi:predicted aspartyl protease
LKFKLYRGYLIVTQGAISDLEHLNMVIDTGTDPTVINRRVATRLRLKLERGSMGTLGGSVPAWQVKLPWFQIGPVTARDLGVLVEDLSFLEKELGTRVDALVGLDVLGRASFIVDYQANEISFGPRLLHGDAVAFQHKPPFITVPITLDNHAFEVLVDTAASSLMLFKARTPTAGFKPSGTLRHSRNFAGRFDRQRIELTRVSLGRSQIGRQSAFLVEDLDRGRDQHFDGLLNPATFGVRQLSFDFEQSQLSWTR